MKPHLKLSINGRISVLRPAITGMPESEMKRRIGQHYGSMSAFAVRFGFRYSDVVTALCMDNNERTSTGGILSAAGGVSEVRQVLGLFSRPSKAAIAQVAAQARWRKTKQARYAPAPQPPSICVPDSLSHSMACTAECPSANGYGGVSAHLDGAHA